ncbi:hypothetical protein MKW98_003679 [Papaver atlanticum]|uniref:Uncharacterized protein n=1 Tax=Papaver atlanticum TaxID=357466 RepID=A0AAD4XFE0_9MAGN|nr:hypothetical protein MKW98_003679 [Papaver atlanticum]
MFLLLQQKLLVLEGGFPSLNMQFCVTENTVEANSSRDLSFSITCTTSQRVKLGLLLLAHALNAGDDMVGLK